MKKALWCLIASCALVLSAVSVEAGQKREQDRSCTDRDKQANSERRGQQERQKEDKAQAEKEKREKENYDRTKSFGP